MTEKILDKDTEQIVELLMLIGSKTKEALRCIPQITFFTGDQFPFRKKAISRDRTADYKKFPEVIKIHQCTESR